MTHHGQYDVNGDRGQAEGVEHDLPGQLHVERQAERAQNTHTEGYRKHRVDETSRRPVLRLGGSTGDCKDKRHEVEYEDCGNRDAEIVEAGA